MKWTNLTVYDATMVCGRQIYQRCIDRMVRTKRDRTEKLTQARIPYFPANRGYRILVDLLSGNEKIYIIFSRTSMKYLFT